jgi:serine/threonine-protein kinase
MATQMVTITGDASAGPGGSLARGTLAPPERPRSISVLPRVQQAPGGEVELLHQTGERYRRLGVLGEGGMGVVEHAEDVDIGRPVAIKRLLPEAMHPLGVARFVSEIRIVGSLDHPNVVPIHDVGVDEAGRYFFVMKYVEGQTLADIIDKLAAGDPAAHAFWSFERRAELMVAVLQALEYAHERGVLHRDIKPENIMVGRHGEVRLMDWGIACRVDEKDPEPALIGTPAYMSPEQTDCADLDPRSDLYSATVTFHEFIALRHYLAHRADSVMGVIEAVRNEERDFMDVAGYDTAHQSRVPPELRYLCRRGMAKDRAQRYASAGEMIADLRRFLDGRTEVKCIVTLTKRAYREGGRFVDRHPRLAVGLAATQAGLTLFGLGALVWLAVG